MGIRLGAVLRQIGRSDASPLLSNTNDVTLIFVKCILSS